MQQLSAVLTRVRELPEHQRWMLALGTMVLVAGLFIAATVKITMMSINTARLNAPPSRIVATGPSPAGSPHELSPAEGISESLKGVGLLFVSQDALEKAKPQTPNQPSDQRQPSGIAGVLRSLGAKIGKTFSNLGLAVTDQINRIGK